MATKHIKKSQKETDESILGGDHTYGSVNEKISSIVLTKEFKPVWLFGFAVALTLFLVLQISVGRLFTHYIGIWGINVPVGWGFDIINFVWWIGIGHAGTLISAILLLFKQQWRTSINRFAEAMTLFAVACAALFPILHLGRPEKFYWLFPYPSTFGVWPQFRSPLEWDVFAVSTYATVSALFWYVGLVPDLAALRDRTKHQGLKVLYGVLCLGWRGSARHWFRYETAYLLLAGLGTPLVLSVHSIIGLDFATSIVPGWHATIFPPYFVAGAIFAGFAMVITLAVPLRKIYHLEDFITMKHLDNMAKVMLATGMLVGYGYAMEAFMAFYSGNNYEIAMMKNRLIGHFAPFYWALIVCNLLAPQILWSKKARGNLVILYIVAMFVNVGMWLERYIIIVTSLARDFIPSSWHDYAPTIWDWGIFLGTFGLFFTLFFLFIRFVPMISVFEMQELVHKKKHGH